MTKKVAVPEGIKDYLEGSELVWFRPTEAFFKFFLHHNWRWRRFHDCGAGVGALTRAMKARRLECAGWDMYPRKGKKSLAPVGRFDTARIAERMDTSEVAILARPCHHPDFIDATINSALEIGEAFYIGKVNNVNSDLAAFAWDCTAEDVGEDGELLARIRHVKGGGYIQRLIKTDHGTEEWWWYNEKRDCYVQDPTGISGFDALGTEVIRERRWANELQDIRTKEEVCSDDSDMGWIAPDGEWFGCRYAQHDTIAREVLGCSIKRLEELSFVRCHGKVGRGHKMWTCGWSDSIRDRKPTRAQRKVLVAKGYNLKF